MSLERLRLFAELAKRGSYTKTAESLGVSKAFLSKQIRELEQELNTQLIIRNTRNMRLTSSGEVLFEQANKLTTFWQDTKKLLDVSDDCLSGIVRFTAPTALMKYKLLPVVNQLLKEYPDIGVVSDTGNQTHNLVDTSYDFAVRITNTPPQDMVAVKLLTFDYACCATPEFIAHYSLPTHPNHLLELPCISLPYWKNWLFIDQQEAIEVRLESRVQFSDNELLKQSVLASHGISRLPRYMIEQELVDGRLVEVLADYTGEQRDVYLLYPQALRRPERVKLLMNRFKTELSTGHTQV
ncbi:hypothetical protein C2869_18385 [Saccharobesus litoralis]|uniref:HTH lysR-type domain-containing protein n=1 Tax=Saccharobesus litoralis TaxID=2172099 RepID=A0A2S0VVL7_9ALTE|nr:LysR family transcriptional regulator [Saccharobesus litoralis]AWB68259.1 hypothetical protein C2869_18385 [Saccharobesus litoralis]